MKSIVNYIGWSLADVRGREIWPSSASPGGENGRSEVPACNEAQVSSCMLVLLGRVEDGRQQYVSESKDERACELRHGQLTFDFNHSCLEVEMGRGGHGRRGGGTGRRGSEVSGLWSPAGPSSASALRDIGHGVELLFVRAVK